MIAFLLRLAWRDTRASRRRLLLYSSTIVLGIAALVAVGSFGVNVRQTIGDQPKRLLGADLRVGLESWPNPAFQTYMEAHGAEVARRKLFWSSIGRPAGGGATVRRPVQVVAIDSNFPFYGDFTAQPVDAVGRLRRGERVAILDPHVAERYHLAVGDRITLAGAKPYVVAGIVDDLPGESSLMLSLTGRVFIPWSEAGLEAAKGKTDNGNYQMFFRLPAQTDVAALATEIKSRFSTDLPVVMTSAELGKQIDNALDAGTHFFALVLFVALFLGAIGVASALHVYIHERLARVAVLRCLGMSGRAAMGVYLLQAAALGIAGAVGGAALGLILQFALPPLTREFMPVHLEVFFAWRPVLTGMVAGFAICLVFALLPLLAVRRVPPLAALRSEASEGLAKDPLRIAIWGLIALAVAGFAYLQTHAVRTAIFYTLGLTVAFAIFAGVAAAVAALARVGLPAGAPYVFRQGIGNLHRPRNRTLLLLLAMGMGLFLVLTIYLTRSTIRRDFAGENSPNLILSDIADEDLAGVQAAVRSQKMPILRTIPTLQLHLQSLNGKKYDATPAKADPKQRRRPIRFDGHVQGTFRDHLLPAENLTAGKFIGTARAGDAVVPITVQQWMTGGGMFGPPIFKLGDEAVWDVEGVPIRTKIVGVRRAQGMSMEPPFAVVFPAGSVDGAPAKTLLYVRSPSTAASTQLSNTLAKSFPRVRSFDIAALLETAERIFSKVAVVVDFIAFFTVATGMIILASAVVAGRHQRARESVLLRAMGATRGQLRWIQFTEYGVLGLLAGIVGCGLAAGANALLAHFILRIPAGGGWAELAAAGAAIVATTVATGVFADRGLAQLPPLEILREET